MDVSKQPPLRFYFKSFLGTPVAMAMCVTIVMAAAAVVCMLVGMVAQPFMCPSDTIKPCECFNRDCGQFTQYFNIFMTGFLTLFIFGLLSSPVFIALWLLKTAIASSYKKMSDDYYVYMTSVVIKTD